MATSSNPLPPVPPSHFYQQQQQQQQLSYPQQQQQAQGYYSQPQQAPGQQPYQQQNGQQQPPQQPQHPIQANGPDGHPRAGQRNRTFSFQSNKSHKSTELVETSAEKEAKRLHSKADPTLAMSEAEPGVVAATVKSSLAPLRNMRHKDMHGNVIDDPDRSNPTRNRWERPLDTIRSFEAAIDDGYNNNRQSMIIRSDSDSVANWDRRSSYFAPSNAGGMSMLQGARVSPRPRSMVHGHSQHRLTRPPMPGNAYNGRYQRDSYYSTRGGPPDRRYGGWTENQGDPYGPQGYNAYSNVPRTRYSRMAFEPQFPSQRQPEQNNVYPLPMNHRSYETVASGSGSGSSGEHAGYQTDPTSSDNSSIERVQSPPKRQEPINDYGIGFSQDSNYQAPSFTVAINGGSATPGPSSINATPAHEPSPPLVPSKQGSILRKPSRALSTASVATERPGMGEKRKSWFARRFSKNS